MTTKTKLDKSDPSVIVMTFESDDDGEVEALRSISTSFGKALITDENPTAVLATYIERGIELRIKPTKMANAMCDDMMAMLEQQRMRKS